MTTNGHDGQGCDCGRCRARRAGLGPGPYTPAEWALMGGTYVLTAHDPIPDHVAKAMRRFDDQIVAAESAVDAALDVYTIALQRMIAARQAVDRLESPDDAAFSPDKGYLAPEDQPEQLREARAAADAAETELSEVGRAAEKARAALTGLVKGREVAGIVAARQGPGLVGRIKQAVTR